jgi:hypothetical protein
MSCVVVDITGHRFGWLVVQGQQGREKFGQVMWLCQCDCGNTSVVRSNCLRRGMAQSCGCGRVRAGNARTHGKSQTPEYKSYLAMLRRCSDSTHRAYRWYGGRGIKVCERWLTSMAAFAEDMGPRPEGQTLDRIDNEKDYSPDNCRWADWSTQGKNKRKHLPPLPLVG